MSQSINCKWLLKVETQNFVLTYMTGVYSHLQK
jgi:hypothetical protein